MDTFVAIIRPATIFPVFFKYQSQKKNFDSKLKEMVQSVKKDLSCTRKQKSANVRRFR